MPVLQRLSGNFVPVASDLLDAHGYDGVVRRADDSVSMASQATFHGCAVVTEWERAEVEALLPDPLELAPTRGAAIGHPVVFLLGEQRHGAALFGGLAFPTPVVYEEMTMAIPFARRRESESLLLYLPRMVCSFPPATWTGNASYGFGKVQGRVRREGSFYRVYDAGGAPLLGVQVEVQGPQLDPAARRRFAALRGIFELPVFGIRPGGRCVGSYWDLDLREARVRPADASVTIEAPFAKGLRPGEHPDVEAGSFAIDGMVWRLSWPLSPPV